MSQQEEPLTPAAEAFATLHEWYTGMREAGFSVNEAAAIIAAVLAEQSRTA